MAEKKAKLDEWAKCMIDIIFFMVSIVLMSYTVKVMSLALIHC